MTTGKVTRIMSTPRGFVVQTSPGPPPETATFTPVTADQLAVATAAYIKGSDVDVEGTAPNCTNVVAK